MSNPFVHSASAVHPAKILLAGGLAVGAAIGFAPSAGAAEVHVRIANFTFEPSVVTAPAGTTVIFQNDDDSPHLVVAADNSFRSKVLDTGDAFSVPLNRAGTIGYFCGMHPMMTGKIVVTP